MLGKARASILPNIVGIAQRPAEADSREVPGHWEADLIKGAYNRSAVGTMVEHTSRRVLLARLDGCTAQDALAGFTRRLATVPAALRQFLPKGTDLSTVSYQQLLHIEGLLNNRPRAILGFKTPNEVYQELLAKLEKLTPQAFIAEQIVDNLNVALQG